MIVDKKRLSTAVITAIYDTARSSNNRFDERHLPAMCLFAAFRENGTVTSETIQCGMLQRHDVLRSGWMGHTVELHGYSTI